MIIPASWILSLILNIPQFLKLNFDTEINPNYCFFEWPKQWMSTAYNWTLHAIIVLSIVLMAGLYARVVYTLWFKRDDDYRLTYQQQVCVSLIVVELNVL